MLQTCGYAIGEALRFRGLDDVWWGARILDAWPRVVGAKGAEKAEPILEKSPLHERGLLSIAVKSSAWVQELTFLNVADLLNDELGFRLIREVRFELGGVSA